MSYYPMETNDKKQSFFAICMLVISVIVFTICTIKFIYISYKCSDFKIQTESKLVDQSEIEQKIEKLVHYEDYLFDANVLTFLLCFTFITTLTITIEERNRNIKAIDEMKESTQKQIEKFIEQRENFEIKTQSFNDEMSRWENERNDWKAEKCALQQSFKREITIQKHILTSESISSDATIYSSTIISTGFMNHILPSIEATRARVNEFNNSIPSYSSALGQIKDDAIFSNDEITSITKPLYFAEGCIEDLISQARLHFRNNPTNQKEFSTELSPLRDDIHSLIEKFEDFRKAPINRI